MPEFADTPTPPYYAAIFSALRTDVKEGYEAVTQRMLELAGQQPGFLGIEAAADGAFSTGVQQPGPLSPAAPGLPSPSARRPGGRGAAGRGKGRGNFLYSSYTLLAAVFPSLRDTSALSICQ